MSRDAQLAQVLNEKIVAVLRSDAGAPLVDVVRALLAGGVRIVEVTFTVPGAVRMIELLADQLGDRILLGAGTVLDCQTARSALLAGAQFVVTPVLQPSVIKLCHRYGKLAIPGAFSPTEVLTAWETGADIVKLFPCDGVGPQHLRALKGPLPHVRLMPTGGIDLENAQAYFRAGACALGVGGSLVNAKLIATKNWSAIEQRAAQFVAAISGAETAID